MVREAPSRFETPPSGATVEALFERSLPSEPAAAGASRRTLDAIGARLSAPALESAKLLVSELTSNAIRHGPRRADAHITLRVGLRGDALHVEVADEGGGFDPPAPTGLLDAGGWGLVLVDRVADRWGVTVDPATTVWFELDRAARGRARSSWSDAFDPLLLDTLRAAVIATDVDGVITRWNRRAEEVFGYDAAEAIGRAIVDVLVVPGDHGAAETLTTRIREGEAWEGEWLAPRRDGGAVWVRLANAPVHDERGELTGMVGVCVEISERKLAASALAESERRRNAAREQVEKAHDRLSFVAEASMLLSASLDSRKTLSKIARLVVPRVAEWCTIDLLEPDGTIQAVVVEHADPEKVALAREYRRRYPSRREDVAGAGLAIRTGESQLHAELTEEMLEERVPDSEQRRALRELGIGSVMVVPLQARGRALGAITFVSASEGAFGSDDLELAEDLARRAALAIDNARLYEERSRVARTLQRSLLPRRVPNVPGLEIATFYQPAGATRTDVGGDFFDVFEVGEGAWGIVVGDVCGKGVEAAALTGMARHTIRASALRERSPRLALEDLNGVMLREDGERFCTVALGRIETSERSVDLIVACGGHPSPFVLRRRGKLETIGTPGSLLGVFENVAIEERSTTLKSGDLAVFFTDGLIDSRHPTPIDEAGLRGLVQACAGKSAQETVDAIAQAVADPSGEAPDDICVVVVRVAA
jgi:PAS domain S-box-containing protein